jgi:DNA topoisomerase IA
MWRLEKASREKRNQRLTVRVETSLLKIKDKMTNLQATVKNSKRTFSQLVHSDLINSNKHKYISQSVNGREVINWLQLNTD